MKVCFSSSAALFCPRLSFHLNRFHLLSPASLNRSSLSSPCCDVSIINRFLPLCSRGFQSLFVKRFSFDQLSCRPYSSHSTLSHAEYLFLSSLTRSYLLLKSLLPPLTVSSESRAHSFSRTGFCSTMTPCCLTFLLTER